VNQRETIVSMVEAIPEEALPDMLEYLIRHHGQELGKAAKDLLKVKKDLTKARENVKASNAMIKELKIYIKQLEEKLVNDEMPWGPDDNSTPGQEG
jgi:uncharacterized protein Yka (UPF0111/DUF47 family)